MPEGDLCHPTREAEGQQGWGCRRCLLVVCDRDKNWRSAGDLWVVGGRLQGRSCPWQMLWGEMLSCSRSMGSVADVSQQPQLDGGLPSAALPQLPALLEHKEGDVHFLLLAAAWARFAGTKGLEEEEKGG